MRSCGKQLRCYFSPLLKLRVISRGTSRSTSDRSVDRNDSGDRNHLGRNCRRVKKCSSRVCTARLPRPRPSWSQLLAGPNLHKQVIAARQSRTFKLRISPASNCGQDARAPHYALHRPSYSLIPCWEQNPGDTAAPPPLGHQWWHPFDRRQARSPSAHKSAAPFD